MKSPAAGNSPDQAGAPSLPLSFNWRDLGGLPTRDHGATALRRLYRSGAPSQLDPVGRRALNVAGLRTVIDLRTTSELEENRLAAVDGTLDSRHATLHRPLFESIRSNWIAPTDHGAQAAARRYMEMLHDGIDALVQIVHDVGGDGAQPVLIHCAAGRDRTGIVVACLLDLLQVSDEAIAADYGLSDAVTRDGGRAHAATMMEFLSLLRAEHGSTRELLRARGVEDDAFDRMSRALLVS